MRYFFFLILFALYFSVGGTVSAHVVVKPAQVGVASFQTFTVSVPVEKDIPTTQVRLMLPDGLKHITPTVKPNWTIEVVRENESSPAIQIIWSGALIPTGFREEFSFSAKVPASEAKLVWKAYQKYADGSEVAWEITPEEAQSKESDFPERGPASITKVVDDVTSEPLQLDAGTIALIVSGISLLLSIVALMRRNRA